MRKFEISEQVLVAVLNYLYTKPMGEVVKMVASLEQVKEIVEQKKEAEKSAD